MKVLRKSIRTFTHREPTPHICSAVAECRFDKYKQNKSTPVNVKPSNLSQVDWGKGPYSPDKHTDQSQGRKEMHLESFVSVPFTFTCYPPSCRETIQVRMKNSHDKKEWIILLEELSGSRGICGGRKELLIFQIETMHLKLQSLVSPQ